MGYSFPATFIAGGVSLVIAWVIGTRRVHSTLVDGTGTVPATSWFPWIVYNVLLLASFATVVVVSKDSVGAANQQKMETEWADTFPPIVQPLKLPLWFLETHAGAMLSYPEGGSDGGSTISLLCLIVGVAALVRRRQWLLLGLLLAPLGLNFIAAAFHRYPYGVVRMTVFLAPAFCTLIAFGLTAALAWIEDRRCRPLSMGTVQSGGLTSTPRRLGLNPSGSWNGCTMALGLFVLLGARSWIHDLTQPYKSPTALRAREFAQWFWFELAHTSELVSCESDLKTDLSPDRQNWGRSSLYFCNQRIYSPRHARGEKPHLDRVSADRPLRCVLYRSPQEELGSPTSDPQSRQRWLERMQADYDLVAHDSYPFSDDFVEVFKFVPKGGSGAAAVALKIDATASRGFRLEGCFPSAGPCGRTVP